MIETVCPCCGARLKIDRALGQVVYHQAPERRAHAPNLDNAGRLLDDQARRRQALFEKSAEGEKTKAQLLSRKFEEGLKKSKNEPLVRPTRDIDLD